MKRLFKTDFNLSILLTIAASAVLIALVEWSQSVDEEKRAEQHQMRGFEEGAKVMLDTFVTILNQAANSPKTKTIIVVNDSLIYRISPKSIRQSYDQKHKK